MTPPLNQLTSALAGRYEIDREIGAGGMATVYLARDVKHKRNVALKVLKPELGAVLGVDRFLAEIQVTANLQHPNLLPLFDSGEAAGLLFYVMPFVEGESLRARLDREKQLPVDEAVRISVAIAGALQYAHSHGVIHRDLKPENILLQAGQPVIADFGIALAVSNAGGARVTQTGLSLGTPQYMSPEQATGDRAIDARTDIYSLAAMTYEMLTGEPPHTGTSAQAIIAKLMTEDVRPLTVLRRNVPAHVDGAVRHALEKLAADRFATAEDFSLALTGARPVGAPASMVHATSTTTPRRTRALITALAVVAVGGVGSAVWMATRPTTQPAAAKFELGLPPGVALYQGGGTKLALTRDGRTLAFVGVKDRRSALYVRRLGDPVAQLLSGTEGTTSSTANVSPAFSPDGRSIMYGTDGGLSKIAVDGGTPQVLADSGRDPSWGDRDVLLWAQTVEGRSAVLRQTLDQRDTRIVTRGDTTRGIFGVGWPHVLPGGEFALVALVRNRRGAPLDSMRLGVVSLKDGAISDLGVEGTSPHYVSSGHIVYGRPPGLLLAVPFSVRTLKLTGAPRVVSEAMWLGSGGAGGFAVADNGTLAYHTGAVGIRSELVVVSKTGTARRLPVDAWQYNEPRVSPDGRRVALGARGDGAFTLDVATGARQRIARNDETEQVEWMPDGTHALLTVGGGTTSVILRPWNSGGTDSVLARGLPPSVARVVPSVAHGFAAIQTTTGTFGFGIDIAPIDSLSHPKSLTATQGRLSAPAFSADGRLIAWTSNESGLWQAYVQPVVGPGDRLQLSVGGGLQPVWSRTGSTVYYRGGGWIRAVEIGRDPLRVVRRDSLFVDSFIEPARQEQRHYDVFQNGDFLFLRADQANVTTPYIILNWQSLPALNTSTRP